MIMAQVLTWFLIVTGAYLVLNGYWLASFALFRRRVEGAAERYGRRPLAASLVGLGVLTPLLLLAAVAGEASEHPLMKTALLVLVSVPALLALLGSAGLAWRVGSGMGAAVDEDQPWRVQLRGGLVLGLCFLLPFVGWFLVLPWVLVSGFGAAIMGLFARDGAGPSALEPGDRAELGAGEGSA